MPIRVRPWLTISAIAVLVVFVLLAVVLVAGRQASERAREGWEQTLGTPEEIAGRYQPGEANDAALELERLAAAIGVNRALLDVDSRVHPDEDGAPPKEVIWSLGEWVIDELGRPEPGISPTPALVATVLDAHERTLGSIRELMADGELPRWKRSLEWRAPNEGTFPNLLGQLKLQRILAADALSRAQAGDHRTALANLEAGWLLNTALRDEPSAIAQLIAISVSRLHTGLLRRLDADPVVWRPRLAEHDYRRSLHAAFLTEAWIFDQADIVTVLMPDRWWERLAIRATSPYLRLCRADASDRYRRGIVQLGDHPDSCADPKPAVLETTPGPWWNWMDRGEALAIFVPNVVNAFERVGRLELDIELTDHWLALRDARERNGTWPPTLPASPESSACPGDRWIYEFDGDVASLHLSREPAWPNIVGLVLPTHFTSSVAQQD
jgi:hypothetical protein